MTGKAGVSPAGVSSAWADLVPVTAGDRVRLPPELSAAERAFTDRGAVVDLGEGGGVADVVVVIDEGPESGEASLAGVAASGRLVVLATDRRSRLALSATQRALASGDGVTAVHTFALFPDGWSPTSAYRLDLPHIGRIVLGAAAVGAPTIRRVLLALLRRIVGWRVSQLLLPAWMIVVHVGTPPPATAPTGRIGVAANEQGVVLLGARPDAIEKDYVDAATADRVAALHRELAEHGVNVAQRVRPGSSPTRLELDWMPGQVVDAAALDDAELAEWSARAAAVLGRIHGATGRTDGTVLTHGDYWLGALIADGDEIVGVIDWTDGRRGEPEIDIEVLSAVVHERRSLSSDDRNRILGEMARRYVGAGGPSGVFRGSGTLMP